MLSDKMPEYKDSEPVLLMIETSTVACSAALSRADRIVGYIESDEPKAHASELAVFIDRILKDNGMTAKDCDAVAVCKGPGSYTGLRVGVSTAKGIGFGAGIPVIAVGTLETLAFQAIAEGLLPEDCHTIVPMIDARRMEVYCSVFDGTGKETGQTQALVLDGDSFGDLIGKGKVLFIGDGAEKFSKISHAGPNASFIQCCPKASAMLKPALERLAERQFEDIAYFEPFYLKEFVATKSRKPIIPNG